MICVSVTSKEPPVPQTSSGYWAIIGVSVRKKNHTSSHNYSQISSSKTSLRFTQMLVKNKFNCKWFFKQLSFPPQLNTEINRSNPVDSWQLWCLVVYVSHSLDIRKNNENILTKKNLEKTGDSETYKYSDTINTPVALFLYLKLVPFNQSCFLS